MSDLYRRVCCARVGVPVLETTASAFQQHEAQCPALMPVKTKSALGDSIATRGEDSKIDAVTTETNDECVCVLVHARRIGFAGEKRKSE